MAGDRGGASVELALTLPVVVGLLGLAVGGAVVAASAVRVADAAAVVARQVARGDADRAGPTLEALVPGARWSVVGGGDLVCVEVHLDARAPGLPGGVPVSSRSCAPRAGR